MRDEETGDLWCPTAMPIRDEAAAYVARHGWGYSRFEHDAHDIAADLLQYVPTRRSDQDLPPHAANLSGAIPAHFGDRLCRVGAWSIAKRIRGIRRRPRSTPTTGAMFARNAWNAPFGSRVAFADLAGRQTDWTGDRREFIGRNGTLDRRPARARRAARRRSPTRWAPVSILAARCGQRSSCRPAEAAEVVFFLGEAASAMDARALIARYRKADLDAVLLEVGSFGTTCSARFR